MPLEVLVEFALLAVVFLGSAIFLLKRRFWSAPRKSQIVGCDYIVFEAEPVNLSNIKADLAANGWHLAGSHSTSTSALLYRFEKGSSEASCLSEIYDFEKSMPRTANRTTGSQSLIKIHSYGSVH